MYQVFYDGQGVGSPPRAWGQPAGTALRIADVRFTPTGVGTTQAAPERFKVLSVHPHGRGDNTEVLGKLESGLGSPPRAWGQLGLAGHTTRKRRFTPTGVGTTLSSDKQQQN